jgi:hypothetical protein
MAGTADFYAWGLENSAPVTREPPTWLPPSWELNEVGVQSFAVTAETCRTDGQQLIVFAINTRGRWSTASTDEFDIPISTTAGHFPDFEVVGIDFGLLTAGSSDGRMGSFVFKFDPATGKQIGNPTVFFLANARPDKSTILLPICSGQIGLTLAQPRFAYAAAGFDRFSGGSSVVPGPGFYNAWNSAVSQGQFVTLPAGASMSVPVAFDPKEEQNTPALGLLIVGLENLIGDPQARVIPVAVPENVPQPMAQSSLVPTLKTRSSTALHAAPAGHFQPRLPASSQR